MADVILVTADEGLVYLALMERFESPEFQHAWLIFSNMAASCPDSQSFQLNCPPHSEELAGVERVLRTYDMAGALVKHGALHKELLFETVPSPADVWTKAEPWMAGMRSESSRAHQSLEWLAAQFDAWVLSQVG